MGDCIDSEWREWYGVTPMERWRETRKVGGFLLRGGGVADFDELWSRRTTLEEGSGRAIELMSLQDLVAAKKTQRDKDWPMVRRLIEANYAQHREAPSDEQVHFWLLESRTPEMLVEIA